MEITIQDVLSVFKNFNDSKRVKDIKEAVLLAKQTENEDCSLNAEEVGKQIEKVIKEDKALDKSSYLTYTKGKYKKRKSRRMPNDATSIDPMYKDYMGRAGEYAVMSELMYRGYNATRMSIDNGIDIVAVKNNIYYYIQVKTTTIKEGKIYAQIGVDRFNEYIGAQLRYIIVARYCENGIERNMFFMFTSQDIQRGIFSRYIKQGENVVSIKIRFDEHTGEPMLYDEKENNILWNMNRFDL